MKKLVVCALCAAMVIPAMSVSVSADSKELVLYTWENMFPQEVLDGFEKETGIKVVYSNFDTDENMLEKLSMAKVETMTLLLQMIILSRQQSRKVL